MEDLRKFFFLDPSITYLNHGAFGATPRPVMESYQRWQMELERQPVEFLGRRYETLLENARIPLSAYLNVNPDSLVYVPNTTTGINIIARSLSLGPGDEVLASDHEYGALDRTWTYLSQIKGFDYHHQTIRIPATDPESLVDEFFLGVSSHTKVIFISQITSPTAMIFPVHAICKRARELGILTVIDGAHAPGQIVVDLSDIGCDFYSGNLHKWLCAPKGSAFLYANLNVQPMLQPLVVSWGWMSDHPGHSHFLDLFEWTGTRDISAYLAVPDAIHFQQDNHWDAVRSACHQMASETLTRLTQLTGLQPLYPDSTTWFGQMVAAQLPSTLDIDILKTRLYDDYSIEVPISTWKDKNLIRVSYQGYNESKDIDRLLEALAQLI